MLDVKPYDIYKVVGKNIKKYRKMKGITQRKLAEELLLSENFIAKLESDTYQTISIDTLNVIANYLKVDITKFFDKSIMR